MAEQKIIWVKMGNCEVRGVDIMPKLKRLGKWDDHVICKICEQELEEIYNLAGLDGSGQFDDVTIWIDGTLFAERTWTGEHFEEWQIVKKN